MDIELARNVVRSAFRSAGELQQLLPILKERCDPQEYETYAKAIASAVAEITLEVMNRALASYPEIEREVEASIAQTGRYG